MTPSEAIARARMLAWLNDPDWIIRQYEARVEKSQRAPLKTIDRGGPEGIAIQVRMFVDHLIDKVEAPARVPRAGRCTACGCTEEAACVDAFGDACAWVDASRTKCSSCVVAAVAA